MLRQRGERVSASGLSACQEETAARVETPRPDHPGRTGRGHRSATASQAQQRNNRAAMGPAGSRPRTAAALSASCEIGIGPARTGSRTARAARSWRGLRRAARRCASSSADGGLRKPSSSVTHASASALSLASGPAGCNARKPSSDLTDSCGIVKACRRAASSSTALRKLRHGATFREAERRFQRRMKTIHPRRRGNLRDALRGPAVDLGLGQARAPLQGSRPSQWQPACHRAVVSAGAK